MYRNVNIMDNMLRMMEKYADNLEELVEEKTHQYMEEKKKADLLLYSMMPVLVLCILSLFHKNKISQGTCNLRNFEASEL